MRRDGLNATQLHLWLDLRPAPWAASRTLPGVQDDQACLSALELLWQEARSQLGTIHPLRVGVTLSGLAPASNRQLDLFLQDDARRRKWEALTIVIDRLNGSFGKRVISLGPWDAPPGGYAGGKIACTRIPAAKDFPGDPRGRSSLIVGTLDLIPIAGGVFWADGAAQGASFAPLPKKTKAAAAPIFPWEVGGQPLSVSATGGVSPAAPRPARWLPRWR